MDFLRKSEDKLIDGLNLVIDGLSTFKKSICPGFWVDTRDAMATKNTHT